MIYAIWWVNQADTEMAEALLTVNQLSLPEYVLNELYKRSGCLGGGKLYIGLPDCKVDVTDAFAHGGSVAFHLYDYRGIVIRLEDAPLLRSAPGILTDTNLNLLI